MATWSCVALAGINKPIENDIAFTRTDSEVYETDSTAVKADPGAGNTFTLSIDDGKTVTLKSVNPKNKTSTVIDAWDRWGNHVYTGGHLIVEQVDLFEKNKAPTEGAIQDTKRTLIHAQAAAWEPEKKVDITFKNDWVELIGPGALSAIDANGNTNVTFEKKLTIKMDRSKSETIPIGNIIYGVKASNGAHVLFEGPTDITLKRGLNDKTATGVLWENGAFGGAHGTLTITMDGGSATGTGSFTGIHINGTAPSSMPSDMATPIELNDVNITITAPKNLQIATGVEVNRALSIKGNTEVIFGALGDAVAKGMDIYGSDNVQLDGLLKVDAKEGGETFKALVIRGNGTTELQKSLTATAKGFTGQVAVIDNSSNTPAEVSSHLIVDGDVKGTFEMQATDTLQEAYGVHGYSQSTIKLQKNLTMIVSNADKVMGISARQGTHVTVVDTVKVYLSNKKVNFCSSEKSL